MKTSSSVSKVLMVVTSLVMVPSLTGCTDGQVAVGVGAVAVGAAVAVAATAPCRGGYLDRCTTYYNRRGERFTRCRQVYDGCAYRRYSDTSAGPTKEEMYLTDENFAASFNTSFEAAESFITAIKDARDNQNLQAILDLGFSRSDIKQMAKFQMPSDQGIGALSDKLDLQVDFTRAMMQKLMDAARKLKAEREAAAAQDLH